ncbi:TonB-dependent receptor [Komagataeibacter diospyri]|uniref:TonB-dependent receptor n=1 Tax=Komagataeibacter diospyri TaxID=1932662 RepID=A0A4P5NLR4_9PROT|nr:TonB-dependent receptor [Komagataeibacter diospyri]
MEYMVRKLPLCGLLLAATSLDCHAATAAPVTQSKHNQAAGENSRAKETHVRTGTTAPRPAKAETLSVSTSRNVSTGTEQRMGQKVMQQFVPGTNPLKVLSARTPGLSFSSGDALGLDAWSSSLYMRGFYWNSVGISLDGIPLNDQSYGTLNGENLSQAIITNNIAGMSVSQGGGAVDTMSTTNLGGSIQISSANPSDKMGGDVSQMFGSNASFRTYGRFDTGAMNKTGTKMYISYARSDTHKWKGAGDQLQQQAEAKIVQPIGQDSRISGFMSWSNNSQWSYYDLSLSEVQNGGWSSEYLYPNYGKAYREAQKYGGDADLYDGGQHQVNYLGGLTFDMAMTRNLHWKTLFYANSQVLYGTYADPAVPSQVLPGATEAAPLSEEVWQSHQARYGMTSSVKYNIAHHTIQSGIWLENNNQEMGQFFYNEPSLASGLAPLKTIGPYNVYGRAFMESYDFKWTTDTFQYFLSDTYHPVHNLDIHAGFKSLITTTSGGAQYNNEAYTGASALANGSMTAAAAFLPHVSVNWRFLPGHELYFDVAENMRGYGVQSWGSAGQASLWAVQDQSVFRKLQNSTPAERDWVYLVGYRYNSKYANFSVDAYHVNDYHHLLEINAGNQNNPILSVAPTDISMYGVDAALTLHPFQHGVMKGLSMFNSVSYNHATYGSNLESGGQLYSVNKKNIVNYPQVMYKSNLTYAFRGMEAHIDANYYSRRQYSYTNDTSVPAYWLVTLGARYRFGDYGPIQNLTFDFSVYNLANSKYISMMGENGNPMSGDLYSMERGAIRQYFGTVSAHF